MTVDLTLPFSNSNAKRKLASSGSANEGQSSTPTAEQRNKTAGKRSKTEVKLSLVAQRLSMLQNDDTFDSGSIPAAAAELVPSSNPVQCKRGSHETRNPQAGGKPSKSDIKSVVAQKLSMLQNDDTVDSNGRGTTTELVHPHIPVKSERIQMKRDASIDTSCPKERKSSNMMRAEELQANLQGNYPSFIKCMLRSHVTLGFWLSLPKKFCDKYLPQHDTTVILESEDGIRYDTKYLGARVGLSGGWRAFSIAQNLEEGDVAVFHLIGALTFKVYIVRENSFIEVDEAVSLLALGSAADSMMLEDDEKNFAAAADSHDIFVKRELSDIQDNHKEDEKQTANSKNLGIHEKGSQSLDGVKLTESVLKFEEIGSLQSFNIVVHGLVIDSKFPDHVRKKYYELCCSQRSYLHDNLFEGLNCTLIVGIISETVNITDAIRTCSKASSSQDAIVIWK
ncbi:hypothetical protein Droror1_Dr00009339 [Drosera rotundifolia]